VSERMATTTYPVVRLSIIHRDFLWQRLQMLATHLARTGRQVVFVQCLSFGSDYLYPSYHLRAPKKLWRKARRREGENTKREELRQNLAVYEVVAAPLLPRLVGAFPDDDGRYPPGLLGMVVRFFAEHPEKDGLTGRTVDEDGKTSMGRLDAKPVPSTG
jgi:hypothetical protein